MDVVILKWFLFFYVASALPLLRGASHTFATSRPSDRAGSRKGTHTNVIQDSEKHNWSLQDM